MKRIQETYIGTSKFWQILNIYGVPEMPGNATFMGLKTHVFLTGINHIFLELFRG